MVMSVRFTARRCSFLNPRAAQERKRAKALTLVLMMLASACTSVAPTNPYDPETPAAQQSQATLSGFIVVEATTDLADVQLLDQELGELSRPDVSGRFRIDLVAGSYELSVRAPDHETLTLGTVKLGIGELRDLGALELRAHRGALAGVVTLADSANHAGSVVSASPGEHLSLTDASGAFLFSSLPVGSYTVTVVHSGYANRAQQVIVLKDQTVSMATELASIEGDFSINGGATYAASRDVTVTLYGWSHAFVQASESPSFEGASWAPLSTTGPNAHQVAFTLSAGDGHKTIYVRFSDDTGENKTPLEPGLASGITLDGSKPSVMQLTLGDGSGFSRDGAGQVTATFFAWDQLSGVIQMRVTTESLAEGLSVVGEWEAYAPSHTVDLPNGSIDGEKRVSVEYRDAAGNVSNPVVRDIVFKRDAPEVTGKAVVINDDAPFCTSSIVELRLSVSGATEMQIGSESSLANRRWEPIPVDDRVVYALAPGEGRHWVYARFRDAAGNPTEVFEDDVVVDTIAPSSPALLIAGGAAYTGTRDVKVTLSAIGANLMQLSTKGSFSDDGWATYATTEQDVQLEDLDGLAVVYAAFRDLAGNVSAVATASITLDQVAPVANSMRIYAANGSEQFTSSLSVTVALDVTGAEEMRVATGTGSADVSTASWVPFAPSAVVMLPAGDCVAANCKVVAAEFRDRAKHPSLIVSDTITLDSAPPSTPLITTQAYVTALTSATLTIAAAAGDAFGVTYQINGPAYGQFQAITAQAGAPITFAVDLSAPACGGSCTPAAGHLDNALRLRAVDQAGNISGESMVVITVDKTVPAAPVLASPSPVDLNADFASVSLAATSQSHFDATFDHYELKGGKLGYGLNWVRTAATDGFTFPLYQGNGTAGCVDPDEPSNLTHAGDVPCRNRLMIRAVDKAGGVSSAAYVDVQEDSVPPTQPSLIPKAATVTGHTVTLQIERQAFDTMFSHYEMSGPTFGFVEISPPLTVELLRDSENEFVLRAVDAAGNTGPESRAVVIESSSAAVATTMASAESPDISGDTIVFEARDAAQTPIIVWMNLAKNTQAGVSVDPVSGPRIAGEVIVWGTGDGKIWYHDLGTQPQESIFTSSTLMFSEPRTDGTYVAFGANSNAEAACSRAMYWNVTLGVCTDAASENCKVVPKPFERGFTGFSSWTSCPRIGCGRIILTASNGTQSDVFVYSPASDLMERLTLTTDVGQSEAEPLVSCDLAAWKPTSSASVMQFKPLRWGGLFPVSMYLDADQTMACAGLNPTKLVGFELAYECTDSHGALVYEQRDRTFTPLSTTSNSQRSPAIDAGRAVWIDDRPGYPAPYTRDLRTTRWLALGPGTQESPKIVEGKVAYLDYSDPALGTATLRLRDFETGEQVVGIPEVNRSAQFAAASASALLLAGFDVSGMLYVWEVSGVDNYYGHEVGIIEDPSAVYLSGDFILWDTRSGDEVTLLFSDVRQLDEIAANGLTLAVLPNWPDVRPSFALSDGLAAWQIDATTVGCAPVGEDLDVVVHNTGEVSKLALKAETSKGRGLLVWLTAEAVPRLKGQFVDSVCDACASCGLPFDITDGSARVANPAISTEYVVWEDWRNGNPDIYAYDIGTGSSLRIEGAPSSQVQPDVFDTTVVWRDFRFGNADVFVRHR